VLAVLLNDTAAVDPAVRITAFNAVSEVVFRNLCVKDVDDYAE